MPIYARRIHNSSRSDRPFDPAAYPIIARHFFGIEPLRPIGAIAAEVVTDMKYRQKIRRLHGLGDRVLGEFLAEIGAELGIQTRIDQKLDTFAEIEPEVLQAAGGDDFWQPPIHGVEP